MAVDLRKGIRKDIIITTMEEKTIAGQITCPQCGQLVNPQERLCAHCGVPLAQAAAIAERAIQSSLAPEDAVPIAPEILVPRLGEYLIERGTISEADLQRALAVSRLPRANGQRRLLGQVLLDLELVDRETLDQVVTEQILELQSALQQSNRHLEQRVRQRTSELQNALSKLSELNQLKSNFIANVSHELRTPLTHIKGYLDLMADQILGELTEDQSEALKVMQRAEVRLEELIDELIHFSLASSDELFLQRGACDVAVLISETLTKCAPKARERSISLASSLEAGSPLVMLDAEKIGWVLQELMENAIKFTPPDGRVDVTLRREDDRLVIAVQDTGIGIAPEHLDEIFEPFHQLDGSITRRAGGVGLGLTLVRKIIESHGASIEVQSQAGAGSRFIFWLPILES